MPEHDRGRVEARERMIARDLVARGIRDARVLDAMRRVPREAFVPPGLAARAYDDGPLPIGRGQTISQPYVVAWMAEVARIPEGGRVLDVGTGSGYAAAVLSMLAAEVLSVERHPSLAAEAAERLARLGLRNVRIRLGDGHEGWPGEAPFDAILCAAAAEEIPEAWRRQVAPGGRIVAPLGPEGGPQELVALTRAAGDDWRTERLGPVAFVPLLGGTAPG
jgi:protein-L-isoaspartate(D-aspartate) O-methyltransferase